MLKAFTDSELQTNRKLGVLVICDSPTGSTGYEYVCVCMFTGPMDEVQRKAICYDFKLPFQITVVYPPTACPFICLLTTSHIQPCCKNMVRQAMCVYMSVCLVAVIEGVPLLYSAHKPD